MLAFFRGMLGTRVFAVDQSIWRIWETSLPGLVPALKNCVDRLVLPVKEHDRAEVVVVIHRGRAMDDYRTSSAITVLEGEVGVIPGKHGEVLAVTGTNSSGNDGKDEGRD